MSAPRDLLIENRAIAQIEEAADRRLALHQFRTRRHLAGWSEDFRVLVACLEEQKTRVRVLETELSAARAVLAAQRLREKFAA